MDHATQPVFEGVKISPEHGLAVVVAQFITTLASSMDAVGASSENTLEPKFTASR